MAVEVRYLSVALTPDQITKAAQGIVTAPDDQIQTIARAAVEAVLPEILNAHTALLLSRLAKAKAVHDSWAGVHHDSDAHQLLAELHQALFGGER